MKLVISLATRGRPQQLIDTVNRSIANWRSENTVMMLAVDADDTATIDHLAKNAPFAWFGGPRPKVVIDIRAREDTIAAKWNRALAIPGDVYLIAADDDVPVIEGYDAKILEAANLFDDGIGTVYGHMANASFSAMMAPTAQLVEKMGYILPEYFPYWFCDHWTDDIARIIGRIVHADIKSDQSKIGQTQEMREPGWWATWFDAAHMLRRKTAFDIIDSADFRETPTTKARLKSHHMRVDFYSRYVNDQVRAMQPAKLPHDERYLRVKNKAIELIPQMLEGVEPALAAKWRNELVPPNTVVNIKQAYAA